MHVPHLVHVQHAVATAVRAIVCRVFFITLVLEADTQKKLIAQLVEPQHVLLWVQ
jgi:hypothetical protein